MNSSNKEKATAANAEYLENEITKPQVNSQETDSTDSEYTDDQKTDHLQPLASHEGINRANPTATASALVPPEFDLDDFDDEFDDDFEAETAGEYELDDDEYARALLDIVDFEIEGLEAYRDEETE